MGQLSAGQFSAGFLLLFYAMVGFENIGVAAQDMENPTRDVPRAIIVVLITVSLIYFLLFSSVLGAMGGQGFRFLITQLLTAWVWCWGPEGGW